MSMDAGRWRPYGLSLLFVVFFLGELRDKVVILG